MTQAPDFGDLRSLLNMSPTPQAWEQLCTWLESWTSEAQKQRIHAYTASYLTLWQDQDRRVPKRWIAKLIQGDEELPWLSFCRALNLRGFRAKLMREYRYKSGSAGDWMAMFERPHMESISVVDLGSNGLICQDIRRLLDRSTLENVQMLEVQRNMLTNELGETLEQPHRFESTIKTLGLRHTGLEDDALKLMPFERWTTLRKLDLYGNDLLAHTLKGLLDCPNLDTLNVGKNPRLSWNDSWRHPSLKHLLIERVPLKNTSFESIIKHHTLTTVHMWGCKLNRLTGTCIQSGEELSSCHTLNLGMNTIDSSFIEELSRQSLTKLRVLNLHGASLQSQDVLNMLQSPWFDTLEQLYLGSNNINATTRRELKARASLKSIDVHV